MRDKTEPYVSKRARAEISDEQWALMCKHTREHYARYNKARHETQRINDLLKRKKGMATHFQVSVDGTTIDEDPNKDT